MRRITRGHVFSFSALFVSTFSASALFAQTLVAKQVSAPPSDILAGIVRLPDPASTPTTSRAVILPLRFVREANGWSAQITLPVDRAGALALAVFSPDAGTLRVFADQAGGALHGSVALVGEELPGWTTERFDLRDVRAGTLTLRVEAPATRVPADAFLLARGEGSLALETWVTTQRLVGDEPIGVVARLRDTDRATQVESARLVLEYAGQTQVLALVDDGAHEDGARGDGLYGAIVPAELRGEVRAHVELGGTTSDQQPFLRTAQLSFPVLDRALILDGSAHASVADAQHLRIEISALPLAPAQRLHVSAELWGSSESGAQVPVCWLSRMLTPEEHAGVWTLPLSLDTHWLDLAEVHEPFELRQVRVQDPDREVVFDLAPRMQFAAPGITASMWSPSASFSAALAPGASPRAPILINPALMLVHGYCSSGSIWPAADFAQPKLEFLDPNANRTHDQFAQMIAARAQQANLSSFGVIAHSQGGPAALHLLTYYQSGLDLAGPGRKIQSVASPYQGTPLASLGAFACGVNNDMTPSGSATWLAGIPTAERANVWYWTVSNSGSACNFLTNLFLTNPEDGTVEQFRGQLPGANSMGHVVGWCHTTGMSNPACYTDRVRNQAMNSAASR